MMTIWNDKSLRRPAIATALVICVSLFWWLEYSLPKAATAVPRRGDAAEVVYATGAVEPKNWAKVVAMHRRRIVEMCDCEGDRVAKGQVLARLDDIEERAILTELEARRETIKTDSERLAILLKRNIATQVAHDEKITQLREIDARIAAQKDRLFDFNLRAPMDGVVLRKSGSVGEIANTGNNDVLFWVGEPKPLEVSAEVNEEDIAKVATGQSVLLRHDGFPNAKLEARIGHITPKGDPDTKTFNVTLALPDDTPLQIGMSVEANIIVREVHNALLVPVDAVKEDRVLTVENGRVRSREVKTGLRGANAVEIVAGLKETDRIVTPFNAALKDGVRVREDRAGAK